jgi:pyruvate formate-lyase activating enzyme-like uncharacterized protein
MEGLLRHRNRMVERNRLEYGISYDDINWINYRDALELELERDSLLSDLNDRMRFGYKGTKTDVSRLSPGCKLCAEGQWSCLFINGKCNCKCFYCPAPQNDLGAPVTQTLTFEDPYEYVDYLRQFDFKGVSFSGGEPFLSYERMLRFLKVLRKEFGDQLYIWGYTNGTLVDKKKLKTLADEGLDELRFDIGATHYDLRFVKQALGIIPNVTVEIPAVPDEVDLITKSARELYDQGLSFMNLHQLRLTPYNMDKLMSRGYKVAHGPRATLPESEIAALKVLKNLRAVSADLPVNYCSYVYKNRFQKSGLRHKLAPQTLLEWEDITENGYIRNLSIDLKKYPKAHVELEQAFPAGEKGIQLDNESGRFRFKLEHLSRIPASLPVELGYRDVRISEMPGEIPDFEEVKLQETRKIFIETAFVINDMEILPSLRGMLERIAHGNARPEEWYASDQLFWIAHFEIIEEGLSEYY